MIAHNAKVGDFCYIDCGAVVKFNNLVGFKIKIAANSVVEKQHGTEVDVNEKIFNHAGVCGNERYKTI